MQVTLRQFAGQFAAITEAARALPRFLAVRNLADTLIDASEREEAAIRRLRDEWRPDDPTVFEDVHSQRSAASAIQKQVQDQLGDLRDPSFRERVSAYASEVQSLNFRWDGLHRTYDEIRLQDAAFDPAAPDSVSALGGFIDLFREGIIEPIRALPASGDTAQMSRNIASLAETAEAEDLALRRLTGTLSGIPTDLRDLTLYGAFDDQLVSTNATRRLAVQELADILANTSQENKDDVQTFANEYDLLVRSLNAFHNGYDDWRESEGGCDRAKSVKTLGQLTLDFGKLTTSVRGLPNAIFLRPLAELLVEAAEREEQALRDLRNNWRPFDADVYSAADRERIAAQKLRRQVAAGGQDILPRFKISQQDVTP